MDISTIAELESQRLVKAIEVDNPEVLEDIPEYKDESDGLGVSLVNSDDAIKAEAKINQEGADVVLGYKKEMAETVVSMYVRAESKARSLQLSSLAKLFKQSFSYFYYTPKLVAVARAEAAEELLKSNDKVLVNLETKDFTDLAAKIAQYKGTTDVTKTFKQNKKAEGTDALSLSVAEGKVNKQAMVKLIEDKYSVTNPTLAEKATLAGTTNEHVGRHIAGKYSAIDADTLLAIPNPTFIESHTTATNISSTKTIVGDKAGEAVFETHQLSLFKVIAEATGYISSAETPIIFVKNEANELVIHLKKL